MRDWSGRKNYSKRCSRNRTTPRRMGRAKRNPSRLPVRRDSPSLWAMGKRRARKHFTFRACGRIVWAKLASHALQLALVKLLSSILSWVIFPCSLTGIDDGQFRGFQKLFQRACRTRGASRCRGGGQLLFQGGERARGEWKIRRACRANIVEGADQERGRRPYSRMGDDGAGSVFRRPVRSENAQRHHQ